MLFHLPKRKALIIPVAILLLTGGVCLLLSARPIDEKKEINNTPVKSFKALVLYENGGHHLAYTNAAIPWLNKLAADSGFSIVSITKSDTINEKFLNQFKLIIQLDYPPYGWKKDAVTAFEKYIEKGKGGWIGFHHATLLGEFDNYPMWNWFHRFMGNIRWKNYIADFASGKVNVEDAAHPAMKGLDKSFNIEKEEWYTYDRSPRPDVHVLASVDESTYTPARDVKMGDHPVIWTNDKYKARNIYIFMGHDPGLFDNDSYTRLFRNAIFWAASRTK